jgi:hypothetical protein
MAHIGTVEHFGIPWHTQTFSRQVRESDTPRLTFVYILEGEMTLNIHAPAGFDRRIGLLD